jgi:hypothetical protein
MVWIDTDGTSLVVITEFCGFIVVVIVIVIVLLLLLLLLFLDGDHAFYSF